MTSRHSVPFCTARIPWRGTNLLYRAFHPILSPSIATVSMHQATARQPRARRPEDLGLMAHQVGELGAVEMRLVARVLRGARRRGDQRARAVRALAARVVQQPVQAGFLGF